jgi:hypothetical protein
MTWLAITALLCTFDASSSRTASQGELASRVRACKADDAVACDCLEKRLETLFADGANRADGPLAHKLAAAAVKLIGDAYAPRIIVDTTTRCAANDGRACNRIANVLVGLFTGAEARLDVSADRLLAHAFAAQLTAAVQP